MGTTTSEVKLIISADNGKLKVGLSDTKGQLRDIGLEGLLAGKKINSGFTAAKAGAVSISRQLSELRSTLIGLFGVQQLARFGAGFVKLAEDYRAANNGLKILLGNSRDLAKAQNEVFEIAQRTGTAYSTVATLYGAVNREIERIGGTIEQATVITDLLVQSLDASGTSAADSAALVTQFTKSLAEGEVSGKAFVEILQKAPALAQQLANALTGGNVNQLVQFAKDGALETDKLFNAMLKLEPQLKAVFSQSPAQTGASFERLKNSASKFADELDRQLGVSNKLILTLDFLAANLKDVVQVLYDLGSGALTALAAIYLPGFIKAAVAAFGRFILLVNSARLAVLSLSSAFTVLGLGVAIYQFASIAYERFAVVRIAGNLVAQTFALIGEAVFTVVDAVQALFTKDTISNVIARAEKRVEKLNKIFAELREEASKPPPAPAEPGATLSGQSGGPALNDPGVISKEQKKEQKKALEEAAKEKLRGLSNSLEQQLALFKENIKAESTALDRELANNAISFKAYADQKIEAEQSVIDMEIEIKQRILESTRDESDRAKLIGEITLLEFQRGQVAVAARADQKKAENDLLKSLDSLKTRLLRDQGQEQEAIRRELDAEFKDTLARLKNQGNATGVELIHRIINVELAKSELSKIEDSISQAQSRIQQRVNILNAERDAGLRSDSQTRKEILATEQELSAVIEAQLPKMQEIADSTGDPKIKQRIEELKTQLQQFKIVADEVAMAVNDSLESNLAGAFEGLINGTKNVSAAFTDMVNGILADMARIVSRKIAENLFSSALGLFSAGTNHTGGMAGTGPRRQVPMLAFAGAPRLHSGGIAGLRSDEVPAILQRGEEVLTRKDPRHRLNAGMGSPVNVTIVAKDADSFRTSLTEIGASIGDAVRRGQRNR